MNPRNSLSLLAICFAGVIAFGACGKSTKSGAPAADQGVDTAPESSSSPAAIEKDADRSDSEADAQAVRADDESSQTGLFGQYVGVLKHAKIERDQMAKLDFIFQRQGSGSFNLMAVLTLFFGDFGSKEYVSYHFRNVTYNLVTGELVFDQADQDLTLEASSLTDGNLSVSVRSASAGNIGKLELRLNSKAEPARDLVDPVMGSYKGQCMDGPMSMQLVTYRAETGNTSDVGNPFGAYETRGLMGNRDDVVCANARGIECVKNVIESASYNFFEDQLIIFGKQRNLQCRVTDKGLSCGEGCQFERVSDGESVLTVEPRQPKNHLMTESDDQGVAGIEGEYRGFLHHEYLDRYQSASVNISTYQIPGDNQAFKMSAVAKLYFGDFTSFEFLTYRFEPTTYDLFASTFVFERVDGGVDAMLQVTDIGEGVIRGTWYSRLFGRVGTFEFIKGDTPVLPAALRSIESLTKRYDSNELQANISVRPGSAPHGSFNPFSPMVFGGFFYYHSMITPRMPIVGGSYDIYTDRIALVTNEGARVAVGEVVPGVGMKLRWPSVKWGVLMHPWSFESFSVVRGEEQ